MRLVNGPCLKFIPREPRFLQPQHFSWNELLGLAWDYCILLQLEVHNEANKRPLVFLEWNMNLLGTSIDTLKKKTPDFREFSIWPVGVFLTTLMQ